MTSDSKTLEMTVIEAFIGRMDVKASRESSPTNPRKFQSFFSKHLYNSKHKDKFSLVENHAFKWLSVDPSSSETTVANLV